MSLLSADYVRAQLSIVVEFYSAKFLSFEGFIPTSSKKGNVAYAMISIHNQGWLKTFDSSGMHV